MGLKLEDLVRERGWCKGEVQISPVSGGCIFQAHQVQSSSGTFFVKSSSSPSSLGVLEAERDGLLELREKCSAAPRSSSDFTLCIPEPLDLFEYEGVAYLLMQYLNMDGQGSYEAMASALAQLHSISSEKFGWWRDNYIGATPQVNRWESDWLTFLREQRYGPMLKALAERGYHFEGAQALLDDLEVFFPVRPQPRLLHGDLWSGNAAFVNGQPCLFDPAVHYGDPECDLAMTQLFGGFPRAFYERYDRELPPREGRSQRICLYQWYHILNHVLLFGRSYLNQAEGMLQRLLGDRP